MAAIIEKKAELVANLRAGLLAWYDAHGRDLPWRKGKPDPYRVWLSEVMLQQTTTAHAAPYYEKFLALWPTVSGLAAAPDERVMAEWAGLGYYSRARNLIKCVRAVVSDYGGRFPSKEAELLKLPGFGPYTAAAVAAIAFGQAANVIDGNIERVMTRLYAIETPLPEGRGAVRQAAAQWVSTERAGDWPQALMDLAATVCRVKAPACLLCPLREGCAAFARGTPERFPVKTAKTIKPRRIGAVFLIVTKEGVIAERRPDKGLLGGMLGLPHTDWGPESYSENHVKQMFELNFEKRGSYEHAFTHFALTQDVWVAKAGDTKAMELLRVHNGWQVLPTGGHRTLPTVFRKALKFL
ncbi:MAG TPA: A/G-specific adenine glycosylase [Asticcacaulis sp.]|nr:A/G-specific adenine glycosylase [Asticcacaulis sp.]